jgi:hypothetical protein
LAYRLNPPPGWPPVPAGFVPPPGWQPDPSWPPAPPGWQLWVPEDAPPGNAWAAAPANAAAGSQAAGNSQQGTPWPAAAGNGQAGIPQPGAAGPGGPGTPYTPYTPYTPSSNASFEVVQPRRGGNGLAAASLVLGFLAGPLGLIFGIIALRKRPQRGKGMAIAGICLSTLWIIGVVAAAVVSNQTASKRSADGQISKGGHMDVFALRTGDCFQNPTGSEPASELSSITAVACTTPHNAQVISQLPVSGSDYPGETALTARAGTGCKADLKTAVDKAKVTDSMNLLYLFPDSNAWDEGQHTISCLVVDSTKDLTSSLLKK